jgi:hypothetical protein
MATTKTVRAADGTGSRTPGRSDSVGANLPLEAGARRSKRIGGDLLVDMNRLSMLAKVVQARESSVAVTLERPLPGMLPNMTSKVLTSGEAQITGRVPGAEESLALLLSRRRFLVSIFGIVIRAVAFLIRSIEVHGRPPFRLLCPGLLRRVLWL